MNPVHPNPSLPTWEQLGGTDTVRRIVELFIDRALDDVRVNYDRAGQYPQNQATIARTKSLALAFLSNALDGPLAYTGRSIAEVHQPMSISARELDAFLEHFRDAMRECGLSASAIDQLMAAVAATRPAILGA